MKDMFFDFILLDEKGMNNDILSAWCKARMIPFKIGDDGKPYVRRGEEWLLITWGDETLLPSGKYRYTTRYRAD